MSMGPFELLDTVQGKKGGDKDGGDDPKSGDSMSMKKGIALTGGALLLIKLMFMICGVESNNSEGEVTRRSKYKLHDGL
jgi:hypothetical protein